NLFNQLSGETVEIGQLPIVDESTAPLTFEQFGMDDIMLKTGSTMTELYFIPLPKIANGKEATMNVRFKKTSLIEVLEKEQSQERQTELIIYINQVPHAINLNKVNEVETGVYEATIAILPETMNQNKIASLQFEVTGFSLEDPCEITDERYWLQIDSL